MVVTHDQEWLAWLRRKALVVMAVGLLSMASMVALFAVGSVGAVVAGTIIGVVGFVMLVLGRRGWAVAVPGATIGRWPLVAELATPGRAACLVIEPTVQVRGLVTFIRRAQAAIQPWLVLRDDDGEVRVACVRNIFHVTALSTFHEHDEIVVVEGQRWWLMTTPIHRGPMPVRARSAQTPRVQAVIDGRLDVNGDSTELDLDQLRWTDVLRFGRGFRRQSQLAAMVAAPAAVMLFATTVSGNPDVPLALPVGSALALVGGVIWNVVFRRRLSRLRDATSAGHAWSLAVGDEAGLTGPGVRRGPETGTWAITWPDGESSVVAPSAADDDVIRSGTKVGLLRLEDEILLLAPDKRPHALPAAALVE